VAPVRQTIAAALLLLAACDRAEKGAQQSPEQVAEEMAALKLEPGQWEATNEILTASAPGIPPEALRQMVGQKTSVSNCVTPEQAQNPSANFLSAQKDSNCSYQDFSMKGGRMTGTMSCSRPEMPGRMVMKMEGSYRPASYEMNMDMSAEGMPAGMTMNVKARTTGRRVGPCSGSEGGTK
jgi:hypothetical protein